jgi:hypothetical protein
VEGRSCNNLYKLLLLLYHYTLQVPIGNGGVTGKYYWTQTLYELTVYADVPKGTRARDVQCNISPNSLELRLKSSPRTTILNGKMPVSCELDASWEVVAV